MTKSGQSLPPELLARVCEAVEQFGAAWQAVAEGERPPWIEDALRKISATDQPAFLRELLVIDLNCRRRFGEQPIVKDYAARFPKHAKLVDEVFEVFHEAQHDQASQTLAARSFVEGTGVDPQRPPTPEINPQFADLAFSPGDVLHDYVLLEKLGKGGMGVVFKAQHSRLKKIVAIKVLLERRTSDPNAIARFQREMEAVGQLRHPHVVEAYDAGDAEGTHYLVIEYVAGMDVSTVIRSICGSGLGSQRESEFDTGITPTHGSQSHDTLDSAPPASDPLSASDVLATQPTQKAAPTISSADACEIIRQAALGLQHAHERGLIHRDVKPSNLLLSTEGVVKVLDLGLARLQTEHINSALTSFGMVMGTIDYISPEQVLNSHQVDARTDLYSLGCTMYHLLAGHPPYHGSEYSSAYQKMKAHEIATPPAIPRQDIPSGVLAILDKLLRKQPAERFASAGEVSAALAPFTAGCDLIRLLDVANGAEPIASNSPMAGSAVPLTAELTEATALRPPHRTMNRSWPRWVTCAMLLLAFVVWGIKFQPTIFWAKGSRVQNSKLAGEDLVSPTTPVPPILNFERATLTEPPPWPLGPSENVIPGIVTRPTALPGIERWQVTTVLPRSPVPSVSWSKQGLLAVGSLEGMVRVYDAQTMQLRHLRGPHDRKRNDHPRTHLTWNPQGTWLASTSRDGLRLWKSDGAPGPVFDISYAYSAAWHPAGELLAVRDLAHVHFCRVDGTRGPVIDSHTECLAWSPDGSRLAIGGAQGKDGIRFWKQDGSADGEISNVPGPTTSLAWSPAGDRLVTGSRNGLVQIWKTDGTSGPVIAEATAGLGAIYDLQWNPDGQHIAAATDGKGGQVWNLDDLSVVGIRFQNFNMGCASLAWSPDGQLLAVSQTDNNSTFGIWDLKGNRQAFHDASHASHPNGLASNADGKTLAVPDGLGRIRFWNPNGEQTSISKFTGDGVLHQVQWHPQLADRMSWRDGTHAGFNLWSNLSKISTECTASSTTTSSLAWSPTGDRVIASSDGRVSLWSEGGTKLRDISLPEPTIRIAWSPKGDWLAGKIGGEVRLFQLDGSVTPLPHSSFQIVEALAFDPTGRWLAASTDSVGLLAHQQGIRVWPIPTGEPMILAGHDVTPFSLAWHPTEPWLYSSSYDGRVMKWDVTTGASRTFEMSNEQFIAVDCNRVGAVLTARGWNNSLYRLDPVTLAPVWSAVLLNDDAYATFSPAGELLHGDAEQVEKQLIYILDTADGRRELLKPAEFQQRVTDALKPRPAVKTTTKDQDRAAAEWVLSVGGEVAIQVGDDQKNIKQLTDLPPGLFQTKFIAIDGGNVTDDGLLNLRGLRALNGLRLANTPRVAPKGMQVLTSLPNLLSVILDGKNFTDEHLAALRDCARLTRLVLNTPSITDAAVEPLTQLPELVYLNLIYSPITDDGLKRLLSVPKLSELVVANTKVTDDGLKLLANDSRWKALSIGSPQTAKGVDHLGQLPNLWFLDFAAECLPDRAFEVSRFPKLQTVAVNGDFIRAGVVGQGPLTENHCARIGRFQQIESLSLGFFNRLESAGLAELSKLDRLTSIKFEAIPLTDEGLAQLANHPSLKQVTLLRTQVTAAGLAKFKAARPDVMIETDID